MDRPRLIAVVGELVAVDNFLHYFSGGEVYLDRENSVKKALGEGRVQIMSMSFMVCPFFWRKRAELFQTHPQIEEGAFSTDGLRSGAVLTVSKNNEIKYIYFERKPTDYAEPDDVLQSLAPCSSEATPNYLLPTSSGASRPLSMSNMASKEDEDSDSDLEGLPPDPWKVDETTECR